MGMRFEVGCRCGWKQSLGLKGMALLGKPWDGTWVHAQVASSP